MKIADIGTGLMGPTLERDCAELEDISEGLSIPMIHILEILLFDELSLLL
jgi:hypothetical protein